MKRPRRYVLETESMLALESRRPEWVWQELDPDYGLDLEVTIVEDERVTEKILWLQMKATDTSPSPGKHPAKPIKTKHLRHYQTCRTPVLIVYWIKPDDAFYYVFAQHYIREYDLQDRVTTIGGDYYTDDIGDGYDLVWTSYTIHRDRIDKAVGKIFAALNPGGVYVNVAEGLTDERTRPARMINMMLAHRLGGCDAVLDAGEIAGAMLRAGFRSVHTRSMDGYLHSPAVVDVARK